MNKIVVKSAQVLSAEQRARIEKQYGKADYEYVIAPELIGGIVVITDDEVYDGSLKAQLDDIAAQLRGARSVMEPVNNKEQGETEAAGGSDEAGGKPVQGKDGAGTVRVKKPTRSAAGSIRSIGKVKTNFDGIIKIDGLKDVKYGELLYVEGGIYALALNLETEEIGAALFGGESKVSEGNIVYSTGKVVEIPVGGAMLGRMVNPLGMAIDGLGEITASSSRPVEAPAPAVMDRRKVNVPLMTGIIAIDAMIPIGRGQRELIIGDRQTGKTAIALDTIINQKDKNVICIYVAIGQKAASISGIFKTLRDKGAMDYTVIVASTADDSVPMQYITPFAGCAIAEEFMYNGKDVLIVYDDLSKHAVSYRALSLLLKRPPGREAYPGDIFYLHSRLLERAGRLNAENGGGSMTALPIIETLAGDISAYIPTNVISITDGQIYLETELFHAGVRPAVNVGLSVSRVGTSAQTRAMKKICAKLRTDLAQYRELQIFSQFGADLDSATKAVLIKGERLTEAMKQGRYSPWTMEEQAVILKAMSSGAAAPVDVRSIADFIKGFIKFFRMNFKEVFESIKISGDMSAEDEEKIISGARQYAEYYRNKT